MKQITGALIGISLVLTAVFIPMAFSAVRLERFTGNSLCRSFIDVVFRFPRDVADAGIVRHVAETDSQRTQTREGRLFRMVQSGFREIDHALSIVGGRILKHNPISIVVYVLIIGLVCLLYLKLPSSFLPSEDQGYFITNIQLPVGATKERTDEVLRQVEDYFLKQPEIESFITVAGFSFNGRGQNSALSFGRLKDWNKRKGAEHTVQAVIARAAAKFLQSRTQSFFR